MPNQIETIKGRRVSREEAEYCIIAAAKQSQRAYVKKQLRMAGIQVVGNLVRKKDLEYLMVYEAGVWDKIKKFIKNTTKKAIAAILALGLFSGVALGKDISKKAEDLTKTMNKIHMDAGTGVKVDCKGVDLGGGAFKLTCKWIDSGNKTATVEWTNHGGGNQDIDMKGQSSSAEATGYAKDFYDALESEAQSQMN